MKHGIDWLLERLGLIRMREHDRLCSEAYFDGQRLGYTAGVEQEREWQRWKLPSSGAGARVIADVTPIRL